MEKKVKLNKERLIVALDFDNIDKAKDLVTKLGDEVIFYKIGLELAMSSKYFELIDWLASKNKKIFADLKLFDISATVGKAIKNLTQYPNINLLTIHVASKDIMNQAFINKGDINILAVTILTNLDGKDLLDMGFDPKISLEDMVIKRALLAKECNIDGIVCSGMEAKRIRENIDGEFLVVTPGIRPDFLQNKADDQKRIVTVQEAFKNGADYIVVGRPITQNLEPKLVAKKIQEQIQDFFAY